MPPNLPVLKHHSEKTISMRIPARILAKVHLLFPSFYIGVRFVHMYMLDSSILCKGGIYRYFIYLEARLLNDVWERDLGRGNSKEGRKSVKTRRFLVCKNTWRWWRSRKKKKHSTRWKTLPDFFYKAVYLFLIHFWSLVRKLILKNPADNIN